MAHPETNLLRLLLVLYINFQLLESKQKEQSDSRRRLTGPFRTKFLAALTSLIWVLLLPVMPFKLIIFRYDCIIANFAKGFSWISRIGKAVGTEPTFKFWILQQSKLLSALVYQEVFYQTLLLTSVTEPLGNIVPLDKNIFYQCCLLT